MILELASPADLHIAFPVLKELRPHLTEESYLNIYHQARKHDHFTLVGYFQNETCLGIMGYRILWDFVHGKHLYIDDLVVSERSRSGGIGAKLLKYAESVAAKEECKSLRLCTGIDNAGGRKFYEREEWLGKSIAYKKAIAST